MSTLEEIVTNGDYPFLGEAATLVTGAGRRIAVTVIPDQVDGVVLDEAVVGVRAPQVRFRVRVSEVAEVDPGGQVEHAGRVLCIDSVTRLNLAEWAIDVTP